MDGVSEGGVWIGTSRISRSQGAAIFSTLADSALQCEQISPQVAKAALLGWPEASRQDCMRSVDLGIAHWRNQSAMVHSPRQSAAQLGLPLM